MNTTNFTNGQINWASQHDWFISGNNQQIICKDEIYNSETKVLIVNEVSHTSFQDLRDWAGY